MKKYTTTVYHFIFDRFLYFILLQHKVVAAVVNHTMTLNPIPEMKSSDAYTLLVSSALPQECQRLRLLPEVLFEISVQNGG